MNLIKKQYLNQRLQRFIEQKKERKMKVRTLQEANSICFFVSAKDSSRLEELIQYISENDEKKMTVICYCPTKKMAENKNMFPFLHTVLSKDVSTKGQLNEQVQETIFSRHFELFIDLDTKTNLTSLYLKTLLQADFRIGANRKYYRYFDFTLYTKEQHTIKDYLCSLDIYTSKLKN